MRIAVMGAGAIGVYLAARLAGAGAEVVLLARGAAAEAIRRNGLRVTGTESLAGRVEVAATLAGRPPFDLVIPCVKAFSLPELAREAVAAIGQDGTLLPAVNGIPWWYGEGVGAGVLAGARLESVDPGGALARTIPEGRTLGLVVYLRSEVVAPGVVAFGGGRGLVIGEPATATSDRAALIARTLTRAGVPAAATDDIRTAVWNKLFGNIGLNPLTALSGKTVAALLADEPLRQRLLEVVREAQAIAIAAGARPEMSAEERVAGMQTLGTFRTSMLQDAGAGRPLESAALIEAPLEIARRLGVPAPALAALAAETLAFARANGLLAGGGKGPRRRSR